MNVLVIDIGGTHVKLLASEQGAERKLPSGPDLTPAAMVESVISATKDWEYDAVSIGYPGPVTDGAVSKEPVNLGRGWARFNFETAFRKPVRVVNDAAMQALGSYEGGNMLFLGLGTGLGTALVRDGVLIPLEVAHLPYENGRTYEEFLGTAGLERVGLSEWLRHVARVTALFLAALVADYAVLGGGNVRLLEEMPPNARRGENTNAFRGGFRMWPSETSP